MAENMTQTSEKLEPTDGWVKHDVEHPLPCPTDSSAAKDWDFILMGKGPIYFRRSREASSSPWIHVPASIDLTEQICDSQPRQADATSGEVLSPEAREISLAIERALAVLYEAGILLHEVPELDRLVVRQMLSAAWLADAAP